MGGLLSTSFPCRCQRWAIVSMSPQDFCFNYEFLESDFLQPERGQVLVEIDFYYYSLNSFD